MTLVNKSRVLYKSSGYYFFYSTSWAPPIFFPSDNPLDTNSLNVINGKQGYTVVSSEGRFYKDFAKAYAVKIVTAKGRDFAFDDSVYLIPVNIMYTKYKFKNDDNNSAEILNGDTVITMKIHQHFNGRIINVDAPFLPRPFD